MANIKKQTDEVDSEAAAQDEIDRGPIDRVTNQPLSDFTLTLPDDHPDADAVAVANSQIKVGSAMGRVGHAANIVETREAERQRAETMKAAKETTDAANPIPDVQYAMIPPDVYRAREQARVMAEAKTLGTNRIRPGGEFVVNGQRVNANGEPIEG